MKTIWKFPWRIVERFKLSMPIGAEVLSVQMQGDTAVLWARVDAEAPIHWRPFCVVGTGHEIPSDASAYLGTIQESGYVWHLFEVADGSEAVVSRGA